LTYSNGSVNVPPGWINIIPVSPSVHLRSASQLLHRGFSGLNCRRSGNPTKFSYTSKKSATMPLVYSVAAHALSSWQFDLKKSRHRVRDSAKFQNYMLLLGYSLIYICLGVTAWSTQFWCHCRFHLSLASWTGSPNYGGKGGRACFVQ
jgi:hypothetical protein